jgi:uncharacterized protein
MEREVALVTGASSGIGRELTKLLAEKGCDLVLVARNKVALNEISSQLTAQYPVNVTVVPKDLSLPQAPEEVYETLKQASVAVDVLANIAGIQVYGALQDTDIAEQLQLIQGWVSKLSRGALNLSRWHHACGRKRGLARG